MNGTARELYSWLRSRGIRPETIVVVLQAPNAAQASRLETEIARDLPPSCLDRADASGARTFRLNGLRVSVTAQPQPHR